RVWDADTGEPLTPLLRHAGSVRSAELSPDGRWALTAGNDATVCVWDLVRVGRPPAGPAPPPSGPPRPRRREPPPDRWRSPRGRRPARAAPRPRGADADGEPVAPPLRHGSLVLYAAFSPDGERVVTASDDNTARVWVVRTGELLGGPLRLQGSVRQAAFSADG